jgi:hypothetical protein
MWHPGVLVGCGDRAKHQVRKFSVARRCKNCSPLEELGVRPGLERGGQCERSGDISHRRTEADRVVKRAGDDLDAAVGQPPAGGLVGPTNHRAHTGIATQQGVGNRTALSAGGTQDQDWVPSMGLIRSPCRRDHSTASPTKISAVLNIRDSTRGVQPLA